MDRERFTSFMEDAVAAYNGAYPVIILDTEQRPLHGDVTLKRATGHGGAAHVVFGVPRDLFDNSEYPKKLTFALLCWRNRRYSSA